MRRHTVRQYYIGQRRITLVTNENVVHSSCRQSKATTTRYMMKYLLDSRILTLYYLSMEA